MLFNLITPLGPCKGNHSLLQNYPLRYYCKLIIESTMEACQLATVNMQRNQR